MSKVQILRELVNQRLSAAVEEVVGLCERTIAEYEEEISRSQQQNVRQQKLLNAVFKVQLHRADVQQLLVQQERRSSLDQEEPEPSHIKKEEQKELWISQEGEQLQDMEEADTTMFTLVPMKSEEDEEEVQSSQFQNQTEERRESESVSSSSSEQIKREADGKDCGGSEPARNTYPGSTALPAVDMDAVSNLTNQQPITSCPRSFQQIRHASKMLTNTSTEDELVSKKDIQHLLVQQERRSSLDQEEPEPSHIKKEEPEELWISQEGEQLQDMEEADTTMFTLTLVPVKSEEDEEKVQSSQLQNQTEERRESEPVSSSFSDQREREADGEDCGGPGPARNTYPDIQQLLVKQERRSSLDQEEPEPSHIKKEEEEEVLISQEGEQLQDVEEADVTKFPFTLVLVKSEEDEEKVPSSQLQNQTEERRESESVSSSSTEQIKRESDGEDCGGPEPARNTYPVMTRVLTLRT
ncbi:hypothetical protein LDENG_00204400 [Lucifuga dentata]|nr:hypothetical protein LDENG_00204400 [Lucifuga dentata]